MKLGPTRGTLCAVLFMAALPLAAAETAFDQGLNAFRQQDYRRAVEWFQRSRSEGVDSASLDFNLASSYYKLEQYTEAKRYYSAAARDEALAGLSYYNLGLIALKESDEQAAFKAFRASFESARDDRLKYLAARRLGTLQPAPGRAAQPADRLSGFVSLGAAYDDNVANLSDIITNVSNKSDAYLDLFGIATYQLSGARDDGVQLRAGLTMTRYSDLNIYNEELLSAGVYWLKPLAQWQTRAGLVYYHDRLGGDPFQQRFALQLRADRRYAPGQRLRFRYDLARYDDLDARYSYLSGSKYRLGVEHRGRVGKHELNMGYRYERNDRNDFVSANSFFSYSPTRHTLLGEYEYRFSSQWAAQARYEYRRSDYQRPHISNGVSRGVQEDERNRYGVSAVYRFSRDTEFELGWERTDNDSNFVSEQYESSVILLRANHFFY